MLRRVVIASKTSSSSLFLITSPSFSHLQLSVSPSHHQQKSQIHERLPRIKSYLADENIDAAKSALVQLNVMVSQGIEPDATMYTSLIIIMARAKLEWQAFKLFSRMLEQGVKPLPETYVALRRATNPKRVKIIQQIEEKMAEMNDLLLSEQLGNVAAAAREKNERAADRQMRELLNPSSSSNKTNHHHDTTKTSEEESSTKPEEENLEDLKLHYSPTNYKNMSPEDIKRRNEQIAELWKQGKDVPTMKLDSIEAVMAAVNKIDERAAHSASLARGDQRAKLKSQLLSKLHDEELRIMLTIHRQQRHGTRQQLIHRILSQVPANYLEQTLERRSHYFDSVKQVLELQIEELKEIESDTKNEIQNTKENEEERNLQVLQKQIEERRGRLDQLELSNSNNNHDEIEIISDKNEYEDEQHRFKSKISSKSAAQLTQRELYEIAPTHLEAPWGLIRKPTKMPELPPTPINPQRDIQNMLTQQDFAEIQTAIVGGNLDEIPSKTLRRYCRHFRLKWSRTRGMKAVSDLVEWHFRTFKPTGGKLVNATTNVESESVLGQQNQNQVQVNDERMDELDALDAEEEERRAQQQTLDQYNALVAVGRITDNMRLVDDSSVSKRVIERHRGERLVRKMDAAQLEKEKYKKRMEYLDENMRKMPIGYVAPTSSSKSSSSNQRSLLGTDAETPVEDLLVKTGETTPSRVLGASPNDDSSSAFGNRVDLRNRAADMFNEQLIVDSFGQQQQQEQQQRQSNNMLGFEENTNKKSSFSNIKRPQELPPWEASTSATSVPFNLRTGKFDIGVPETEFYEDATGRYRVRRPEILKHKYRVDEELLPAPQQQRIRQEKLAHEHEMELEATDPALKSVKRGKFRDFISKKKEVERAAKDARIEQQGGRPLQAPRRMSQQLRKKSRAPTLFKSTKPKTNNNRRFDEEQDE